MPAVAAIKIKVMPDSIDTNLEEIKNHAKKKIESEKGILSSFEEQPIAFGLKTLILTLAWPEAKDTSILEDHIKSIPGVSNADIIDYRRALG